jgi:phytoene dehydrogenase-like protein
MPEDDSTSQPYDLILIGSGMGALTVASMMARLRGKRVLVLERHFRAGGYTHTFQRGRFSWDVGVHYIGEMGEGSRIGQLFRLITGGKVAWNRMPDPYDVFEYPDLTFGACSGKDRFIDDLCFLQNGKR